MWNRRNYYKPTKAIFRLLITFILLTGCMSEEDQWTVTKKSNTPDAYKEFIISYPNSIHASEIYTLLKDEINQMHRKAWELHTGGDEEDKTEVLEDLLSQILEIKPKDALALNNLACIIIGKYYDNHNRDRLQEGLELLKRAVENANRQRISTGLVGQVVEGRLINFAQPPQNDYDLVPLRNLVIENLSKVQRILELPVTRQVKPKDLIITGSVVDVNNVSVRGKRIWAVEVGGDIENNNLETKYRVNSSGQLVNPAADTDEQGEFLFKIGYNNSILNVLPNKLFFLTTLSNRSIMSGSSYYLSQKGKLVIVNVDEDTYSLDLGVCGIEAEQ